MASVYYVGRATKTKGKRWHVRWERGRADPIIHLGVYATETLAKKRVRAVLEQLARGEIPTKNPEATTATSGVTIEILGAKWLQTRISLAENTITHYTRSVTVITNRWGERDPASLTLDDVQDWVFDMVAEEYAPGTIRLRRSALSGMLRYGKVSPNPAKDPDLQLPKGTKLVHRMPTRRELALIYQHLPAKYVGVVALMEHGGLRVHEAVAVTHDDWKRKTRRLLVPDSKTTAGIRFVEQIDGLPEMPTTRGTGRVWPDITIDGIQTAMGRACRAAGIQRYSPHDLRHLHISRLVHDQALSPALIARRVGHSSPQMTLGIYAHCLPPEDEDEFGHPSSLS